MSITGEKKKNQKKKMEEIEIKKEEVDARVRACFTVARCQRHIKIYNRRACRGDINDRVDCPQRLARGPFGRRGFYTTLEVCDKTSEDGSESNFFLPLSPPPPSVYF